MRELQTQLWEILVPVADNDGHEFDISHHRAWDEQVRQLTGGLTILRTAKGQWYDAAGNLFTEKVIPVRIACDEEKVYQIAEITLSHYGQLAIMAYQISDRALIFEA